MSPTPPTDAQGIPLIVPPRPSAAEREHELAMAAISRTAAPPEHTVGLTLNAKGDVQIEVTGRGVDLAALAASVSGTFDTLRESYPRGNGAA